MAFVLVHYGHHGTMVFPWRCWLCRNSLSVLVVEMNWFVRLLALLQYSGLLAARLALQVSSWIIWHVGWTVKWKQCMCILLRLPPLTWFIFKMLIQRWAEPTKSGTGRFALNTIQYNTTLLPSDKCTRIVLWYQAHYTHTHTSHTHIKKATYISKNIKNSAKSGSNKV